MPDSKRALQFAASKDCDYISKPEPPSDLWDQIAVLNEQAGIPEHHERTADAFTASGYAEKFGISSSSALRRIHKLMKAGKVQRHGTSGVSVFYTVIKH